MSTDTDTVIDYAAILDRPAPVIRLDEPDLHTHPKPGSARDKASDAHDRAAKRYAALTTAQAATLLRKAFGHTAERALFAVEYDNDDRDVRLIAVHDEDGEIIWYDRTSDLCGTLVVRDRDNTEAYGGPVLPVLDDAAKKAIQRLIKGAEDVAGGWLDEVSLVVGKFERDGESGDLWYDGELIVLNTLEAARDAEWNCSTKSAGTSLDGMPVNQVLDRLRQHLDAYRSTDDAETANDSAEQIANAADALLSALQIRAYEPTDGTDERSEQVVITVHGVDLSIRGRESDLFVHIDSSERDHADAVKYPLVVEVNNAGENDYPTDEGYVACQGRTCTFIAHVDDLDAWEKHNAECPEVDDEGERI